MGYTLSQVSLANTKMLSEISTNFQSNSSFNSVDFNKTTAVNGNTFVWED